MLLVLGVVGVLSLLASHVFHDPIVADDAVFTSTMSKVPPVLMTATMASTDKSRGQLGGGGGAGGAGGAGDGNVKKNVGRAYTITVNSHPSDLRSLERVYQIGRPGSNAGYQWYLLCSILRVVYEQRQDGTPRRLVRCDENDRHFWDAAVPGQPSPVRLFKILAATAEENAAAAGGGGEIAKIKLLPPRIPATDGNPSLSRSLPSPVPSPSTDAVFVSLGPGEGDDPTALLLPYSSEGFNLVGNVNPYTTSNVHPTPPYRSRVSRRLHSATHRFKGASRHQIHNGA